METRRMVMATPFHTDYYTAYADSFERTGRLRLALQWKFRGYRCLPRDRNRLIPVLGGVALAAAMMGRETGRRDFAQNVRFRLLPAYDRWAARQLREGDHVFSSYAYANCCFRECRRRGGRTFLDGGNSHPAYSWEILTEEHRRWGVDAPPLPEGYHRRAVEMMEDVDYVLAPSGFVANSFLERGFREEQILRMFYPVDLSVFQPSSRPRPKDRPFTVVNTGSLSLRKGTPYLLEALRLLHQRIPNLRILLSNLPSEAVRKILRDYGDLPIEWAEYLSAERLAERLRSADLFVLPSLEEGLVRTALQAMACGLPVVLTPNTGANDYVEEGVNGSVVSIRDAGAIADAAESWWERIREGYRVPDGMLEGKLTRERFHATVDRALSNIGC